MPCSSQIDSETYNENWNFLKPHSEIIEFSVVCVCSFFSVFEWVDVVVVVFLGHFHFYFIHLE